MKTDFILILIIVVCTLYSIGFIMGSYTATRMCANIASRFVDIDYGAIKDALGKYYGHIELNYPSSLENASMDFNSGIE